MYNTVSCHPHVPLRCGFSVPSPTPCSLPLLPFRAQEGTGRRASQEGQGGGRNSNVRAAYLFWQYVQHSFLPSPWTPEIWFLFPMYPAEYRRGEGGRGCQRVQGITTEQPLPFLAVCTAEFLAVPMYPGYVVPQSLVHPLAFPHPPTQGTGGGMQGEGQAWGVRGRVD